jgi:methylated-DNA-[protein]-cysteine S-methyltransferase
MSKIIISELETRLGTLILGDYNGGLCLCDWKYRKRREQIDNRIRRVLDANYEAGTSALIDQARQQLLQFLAGNIQRFDLPLVYAGTDFQKSVWHDLMSIDYGMTVSYLSLSRKRNQPPSIRAIAAANGANALSMIVPCHRVIGNDGSLVGYAGGLKAKEQLLQLEGSLPATMQAKLF